MRRENKEPRPMDIYFQKELQRLNEQDIEIQSDLLLMDKRINNSDTIIQIIEHREKERDEEIKQTPDTLLNTLWQNFGY